MASNKLAQHVKNPTGEAMFDSYNGVTYLFQPDQDISPGTYGLAWADAAGNLIGDSKATRVKGCKQIMVKVSDEYASNLTMVPGDWVSSHFAPGERNVRGLNGLEIVEHRIEEMDRSYSESKRRLADVEARELAIAEKQEEASALMAALEAAANEAGGPINKTIAEGLAGLKSMFTRNHTDAVRPAPTMPVGKGSRRSR